MKSFHQMLRDKGYLRPAREHEQSEGWRQEHTDYDWHGNNPAIVPKTPKPKAISSKPAKEVKLCAKDNCYHPVYKGSPLCHEHFLERHRERDKVWRDKQPKTEKRYCGECGKEIRGKQTALLCAEHYNEYQRENRAKNTAELDELKEAVQSKRTSRLEQKWQQIQEEYENGKR